MRNKFLLLLFIVLNVLNTYSQLFVNAELRPRAEFRYGFKKLPEEKKEPAFFINQRTRLNFKFSKNDFLTNISVQDVRIWGEDKLKQDIPSTAIHEAWLQMRLFDSLYFKIGRQEISYDNDRLLSRNNWNQAGNKHDLILFKYKNNGYRLDLGNAFNQSSENLFGTNYSNKDTIQKYNYKTLNFIWANKRFRFLEIGLLGIFDSYQKENTLSTLYMRATYGFMIGYKFNNFTLKTRYFKQNGTQANGKEINPEFSNKKININANYFQSEIRWSNNNQINLSAGCEYISGQNHKNQNTFTAFNTLYGSNHSFNGSMEYFTGAPKSTKLAGLLDYFFSFIYKPTEKLTLRADLHYFSLENNYFYLKGIRNRSEEKYLGTELDLSIDLKIKDNISLFAGYSIIKGDKALQLISGGDSRIPGHWSFVQLTYFINNKL